MASTINASTSAGLVSTADTSGILQLQTGGTTALTVDASQNVGVGLTNPHAVVGAKVGTFGANSNTAGCSFGVDSSGASQPIMGLRWTGANAGIAGSNFSAQLVSDSANALFTEIYTTGATPLVFGTNSTERARIDSSGNLLVGTTDLKGAVTVGKAAPNSAYGQICALSPTAGDSNISGMSVVKYANDSTTAQVLMRFLMNQGGTGQGQINANGANTAAFGSYSDSRLKENIVDLPSQLDNIMALRPVEYDYIESIGGGHQIGFVAQEVQAIYPDLVGEDADGMLTLTDMNKNDARLIKAIQELKAIVDAQGAEIAALKGAAA